MAKEEAEKQAEEASSGGGASWLIVILVTLLALAAGAGGAYFMLGPMAGAAAIAEAEVEVLEAEVNPGLEFQERLVTLEPFIVNVSADGYPRFLKVKIELEAKSASAKQELDARTPQLRDTTILLLSSKRLADITEFEGRALLKDDLKSRINGIVGEGKVMSVLFTDFVVQ